MFGGTTDVYHYDAFCRKAGGELLLMGFCVFSMVLGVFSCLGDVRGKNNNSISISARVARPSVIVWSPRLAVGPPPTPPPASTSAPAVAIKLAFLVLAFKDRRFLPFWVRKTRKLNKTRGMAHKMSWAPRNYACKIVRALRKYLNYVRKILPCGAIATFLAPRRPSKHRGRLRRHRHA